MRVKVELKRSGKSRTGQNPITAQVMQGGRAGDDIMGSYKVTDVESAQKFVRERLEHRFGIAVEIDWVDNTE